MVGVEARQVDKNNLTIEQFVEWHESEQRGFCRMFWELERLRRRDRQAASRRRPRSRSRSPTRESKSGVPIHNRADEPKLYLEQMLGKKQEPTSEQAATPEQVAVETKPDAALERVDVMDKPDTTLEQVAVKGATAHELLRAFLRKYCLDLEAIEAGGETVQELMRQLERLEERRAQQ